jgi:protein-tyrosine-phosphatase
MAEALLRMADGEIESHSAGIMPGEEVHPNAVKVMRELGYDLSGHRPKHVSVHQNIKFDVVAKMDVPETDLADQLSAKWIESWDVPDPADGGLDEYRKVRDLLVERVERAFSKTVPTKK